MVIKMSFVVITTTAVAGNAATSPENNPAAAVLPHVCGRAHCQVSWLLGRVRE